MEYVKGQPYFCQVKDKIKQYSYSDKDIKCDILIIGGGIDGAILNYYLSKKYNVVLVDMARFGCCCTACATVLLEYQLDDYAENLLKFMTETEIETVYNMGLESIESINKFVNEHGNYCSFRKVPSFMYTNSIFGINAVKKEHEFRLKHGFKSQLFTKENNPFPFEIKAGIYNEDGGAEFNPYLFTKQMIENAKNQEMIFENTKINNITDNKDYFLANTNYGNLIKCKKIILATGFNFSLMKDKNLSWKNNALIQDDKEPYYYLRILPDNRLIYGGEDTPFKLKPISEKVAEKKYNNLIKALKNMLPTFAKDIDIDYKFCGAFGSTNNNLGLIGQTENPNFYYFLSVGANGIINAMAGVKIIEDLLENKSNKLIPLFSPLR